MYFDTIPLWLSGTRYLIYYSVHGETYFPCILMSFDVKYYSCIVTLYYALCFDVSFFTVFVIGNCVWECDSVFGEIWQLGEKKSVKLYYKGVKCFLFFLVLVAWCIFANVRNSRLCTLISRCFSHETGKSRAIINIVGDYCLGSQCISGSAPEWMWSPRVVTRMWNMDDVIVGMYIAWDERMNRLSYGRHSPPAVIILFCSHLHYHQIRLINIVSLTLKK